MSEERFRKRQTKFRDVYAYRNEEQLLAMLKSQQLVDLMKAACKKEGGGKVRPCPEFPDRVEKTEYYVRIDTVINEDNVSGEKVSIKLAGELSA